MSCSSSLAITVASSAFQLLIEIYVAIRLMVILLPFGWGFRNALDSLSTVHLCRALSLITMELLTVVPDAKPTNTLAVNLPFVVGAVLVLGTDTLEPH